MMVHEETKVWILKKLWFNLFFEFYLHNNILLVFNESYYFLETIVIFIDKLEHKATKQTGYIQATKETKEEKKPHYTSIRS